MSIPTFDQITLPLLKFLEDRDEHSIQEVTEFVIKYFHLTKEESELLLPSGRERRIYNRVRWAKHYLYKAGLVEISGRGRFQITDRGIKVLDEKIEKLDIAYLKQFESFRKFQNRINKEKLNVQVQSHESSSTPDETIENHFENLKFVLKNELLDQIANNSPIFFENLVIDLMLKLGYGGSEKDARTTLRTNDEGIDGIINEDKLGLDVIYIQAKRWKKDSSIGRPEIQKFAGALQGQRARKGVFITTSFFSNTAVEFVKNIDNKIILIDGQKLAELMIENNIGVQVKNIYYKKEIDNDYFIED